MPPGMLLGDAPPHRRRTHQAGPDGDAGAKGGGGSDGDYGDGAEKANGATKQDVSGVLGQGGHKSRADFHRDYLK